MKNTGLVDNIFANILLSDPPGSLLYNTFVSTAKTFEDPKDVLAELEFSFRRHNGKLFDFNGIPHSFTLEFYVYVDRLTDSNISSYRGVSDRGQVSQIGYLESSTDYTESLQHFLGQKDTEIAVDSGLTGSASDVTAIATDTETTALNAKENVGIRRSQQNRVPRGSNINQKF